MRPSLYRLKPATLGFTLIEILVVMVIIGVLATMALLSVGSREPSTSLEARRLAELLRLATEEAVLQGQEWGLHLTDEGYEFMVLNGATWQTTTDEMFRPRQFPPELEPRLSLEGEELLVELSPKEPSSLGDEQSMIEKDKKKVRTPQILILSSGEVSSFQIALYAREQPTWRIISGQEGNFVVRPLDERR